MNEALIVGALLLVFVGAVSFYLYSRIIFNERKMGLIESLLLDIKMSMDMEEEQKHAMHAMHAGVPAPTGQMGMVMPKPVEVEEVEEYQNVMEEAANAVTAEPATAAAAPGTASLTPLDPNGNPIPAAMAAIKNYDDHSREDLAYLAEKRGLRVTKRMAKGTIIALLQEADKTAPQQGDDVAGSATSLPAVEGSSGGAPLDAVALEEMD
jgi:hypothetical protein